jgi:hypothetical protein
MDKALGFSRIDGLNSVRFYSLARYALVEGFCLLGISKGHTVLLPEYICRDLLAAVYAVGATPVFYPVNDRLSPATDPVDWPRADAVLAVNYFGFSQPLGPFQEYCRKVGARLIEDNAHGFLSRDESGVLLGTRGDIGLFSLRKTFLMVNGAALTVQAADALVRLSPQILPSVVAAPASLRIRRALRFVGGSSKPEFLLALVGRWFRSKAFGYSIPPSAGDAETRIPGSSEPCVDLFDTLMRQDFTAESERRRSLYADVLSCAEENGCVPVFPILPNGIVPYGLPVYCDSVDRLRLVSRRFGLDCFRWPDLPDAVAPSAPANYRRLHVVNFL